MLHGKAIRNGVRIAAAAVMIVAANGVWGAEPVLAVAGSCGPEQNKGCISSSMSYEHMSCQQGEGEDCITCEARPEWICTWSEGETDLEDYWDGGNN